MAIKGTKIHFHTVCTPVQPEEKSSFREKLKRKPKEPLYRPLESLDLTFYHDEVKLFIQLWKEGKSITEIREIMDRDTEEELIVLLMDLSMKNRIRPRAIGLGVLRNEKESS